MIEGERDDRILNFCRMRQIDEDSLDTVKAFVTIAPKNSERSLYAFAHTLSLHNKGAKLFILAHPDCKAYVEDTLLPLDIETHWETESLSDDIVLHLCPNLVSDEYAMFTHHMFKAIRWALGQVSEVLYLSHATVVTNKLKLPAFDAPIGILERGLDDKASELFGNLADECVYIRSLDVLDKWEGIATSENISASKALGILVKDTDHTLLHQSFCVTAERAESPYLLRGQRSSIDIIRGAGGTFRLYLHKISSVVLRMYDTRIKIGLAVLTTTMHKANLYRELAILARAYRGKWQIQMSEEVKSPFTTHMLRSIEHCDEFQTTSHNMYNPLIFETLRLMDSVDSKHSVGFDNNLSIERHCTYNPSSPSLLIHCFDFPSLSEDIEAVADQITNNVRGYDLGICTTDTISEDNMKSFKNVCDLAFRKDEYTDPAARLVKCKFGIYPDDSSVSSMHLADLWAIGTVPFIFSTDVVELSPVPLVEGTHYILCDHLSSIKDKIAAISEEEWQRMSLACRDLYIENMHSTIFCKQFLLWYINTSAMRRSRGD